MTIQVHTELRDTETPDRSLFIPGGRVGILLVHGLGGTPVELRFIAQALARAGHTVYCCQLAGHCGTPEELRRSTWREWYASVVDAARTIPAFSPCASDPTPRPTRSSGPAAANFTHLFPLPSGRPRRSCSPRASR